MAKMNKRKKHIVSKVFLSILVLIALLCHFASKWYIDVYGDIGFDSILYTLLSDLGGVEKNLIIDFLKTALIPTVLYTIFTVFILFAGPRRNLVVHLGKKQKRKIYPFSKVFSAICALMLSATLIFLSAQRVDLLNFIKYLTQQSTVYEESYVDPATAQIVFPEEKQNLIYIYLESMETTFFSREQGGAIMKNAIPELYDLAAENMNFSHNDAVGGGQTLTGGSWTIAGLVSQTAGVPLKTPLNIDGNSYGQDSFLPGITTLSDILHQNGYYQAFMVGSDANFGGRRQYYEQHGTDKIYDYFTAIEDKIIPSDHYVWWGMEDAYLIEYAKQELTEIAKREQPFAFTMLTVDTHHIGGYVCEYCTYDYAEQYENVLACSSRQISAFVEWIQEQDFYEDTTIVISGDHPTMDSAYVKRSVVVKDYARMVYNCFINVRASTSNTKERSFCTLDMFPTTLAAMGCTIEGDRLGLGTNLFSDTPTFCEEMGPGTFNSELLKTSNYYTKNFYFEK